LERLPYTQQTQCWEHEAGLEALMYVKAAPPDHDAQPDYAVMRKGRVSYSHLTLPTKRIV